MVGHIYSLVSWLNRISQLNPKVILYYLGINDAALPSEAGHDAILAVGIGPRMRRYIINNSALVRLIRAIRGSIKARKLRLAHHTVSSPPTRQSSHPKIDPVLCRRQLSDYGTRVKSLFDLTIAMGALPVFQGICIDLANKILLLETDFFDRIHTTPSGSDKIAVFSFDKLQAVVRDQLLYRKANPNPGAAKR